MRITIDTDDAGKVNIDAGEKTEEKRGLLASTPGIQVTDAGPAPIQEIERLHKLNTAAADASNVTGIEVGKTSAAEVANLSAAAAREVSPTLAPQDRETELPLNPLRAGAAAAYEDPANLRKMAVEGRSAAQAPSVSTIDGGSAKIPEDKKSSDAPKPTK
jgi:hypothetical protein